MAKKNVLTIAQDVLEFGSHADTLSRMFAKMFGVKDTTNETNHPGKSLSQGKLSVFDFGDERLWLQILEQLDDEELRRILVFIERIKPQDEDDLLTYIAKSWQYEQFRICLAGIQTPADIIGEKTVVTVEKIDGDGERTTTVKGTAQPDLTAGAIKVLKKLAEIIGSHNDADAGFEASLQYLEAAGVPTGKPSRIWERAKKLFPDTFRPSIGSDSHGIDPERVNEILGKFLEERRVKRKRGPRQNWFGRTFNRHQTKKR